MATATVSIASTVTPGTTLSNPVSLDELQALGTPTVTVDSTATITGVVNTAVSAASRHYEIVEPTGSSTSANGALFKAAYNRLKAIGSFTETSPGVLFVMPGQYEIGSTASPFTFDEPHVHIVGLGEPADVLLDGGQTPQTAMGVSVRFYAKNVWFYTGLDVSGAAPSLNSFRYFDFENCYIGTPGAGIPAFAASDNVYLNMKNCLVFSVGRSSNYVTLHGYYERCGFAGSNTLYVADGAVLRYSICEPTLDGAAAVNAKIYHCALKAALGGNITNDIGTPYNVVDTDVAV